ncbi:MAG: SDR family oxidoreductase [Clostridia bacterium]|nr:SDR family oxidoreductase [Clostridia bacterium]
MFLEEMFGLKGQVALVTGAGRGIGQTVALGLAKAGATVAIFSRTGAESTARMIRDFGGTAHDILADVRREDQVNAGLAKILKLAGPVDILFNNAGVCLHKDTLEATVDEWREVLDINLTGEYIMARAVARVMVEHGIRGTIVNMASMSGSIANIPQWQASYNASKAGVIHLTRSLALEWAPYGIRVNSLSPGYINTPMSVDTPQTLKDAWLPLIPQHRFGEPEELLPAVLYLTSPMAGYTTGADIIVDGGYTAF